MLLPFSFFPFSFSFHLFLAFYQPYPFLRSHPLPLRAARNLPEAVSTATRATDSRSRMVPDKVAGVPP
jgi:hypothetical protein